MVDDLHVRLTIEGTRADVVLDRPDRRNSFDGEMLAQFEDALHAIEQRHDLDVVLLRAEGTAFCGGTDLRELEHLDAASTRQVQRRTGTLVERWHRLDPTTITAFNGPAIGSGAILGLASDLRVAAPSTFCVFPEVGFGIPLTWNGVAILADLVGADRAKRYLLLGEQIRADELLDRDLVVGVHDDVRGAAEDLVERVLATPLLGRAMTKRACRLAGPRFEASANDEYLGALAIALRADASFDWTR